MAETKEIYNINDKHKHNKEIMRENPIQMHHLHNTGILHTPNMQKCTQSHDVEMQSFKSRDTQSELQTELQVISCDTTAICYQTDQKLSSQNGISHVLWLLIQHITDSNHSIHNDKR